MTPTVCVPAPHTGELPRTSLQRELFKPDACDLSALDSFTTSMTMLVCVCHRMKDDLGRYLLKITTNKHENVCFSCIIQTHILIPLKDSVITEGELKLKSSHGEKKRDRECNQTAPSVIVFNPNCIPTPDKRTAEDLLAERKCSLLLPSGMTLQKNPMPEPEISSEQNKPPLNLSLLC